MSLNTNRYGHTQQLTQSPSVLRQAAPRNKHHPKPISFIPHPSKLRPIPKRANVVTSQRILKHQSTARRVIHGGDAMIRQPLPVERGLNKKSLARIKNEGSSQRLLPISPHWTVIEGRIEKKTFIQHREEKWKNRGYTDPTAMSTLNIHGNTDTYFCGFPGKGIGAPSNQPEVIKYGKPQTKIIKAIKKCNWIQVLDLLNETPVRAEQHTNDNAYPLHLCVVRNAPEEIIVRLVEIYPDAASKTTKKRRATPLHLACETPGVPERIILILGDAYPKAARKRLRMKYGGALPLHCALTRGLPKEGDGNEDSGASKKSSKRTNQKQNNDENTTMSTDDWGAVLAVLSVYTSAVKKTYLSKEPIVIAASIKAPSGVLDQFWKATRSKSILLALQGHVWNAALKILNNKNSGAERAKEERTVMNQFPLHVAIEEKAPIEVIQKLIDLYHKGKIVEGENTLVVFIGILVVLTV